MNVNRPRPHADSKRRIHPGAGKSAGFALLLLASLTGSCSDDPMPTVNVRPTIRDVVVRPIAVVLGGETRVTAIASDSNDDALTYLWEAEAGTFADPSLDATTWTAPDSAGTFLLGITVSDGVDSVSSTATIDVGEGSLLVASEPPGAVILLNNDVTTFVTPHFFDRLPVGPRRVRVSSKEFLYENSTRDIIVEHADADTIRFELQANQSSVLDLGREDIVEIGSVTYLSTGTGLLYAAVTAIDGLGLYSSAITPRRGDPNGVKLTELVALNEPIVVTGDNEWLVLTSPEGLLLTAEITNADNDGVIDSIGAFRILDSPGYGVAVASDRIAYGGQPSSEPGGGFLSWGEFIPPDLNPAGVIAATRGRQPNWRPDGNLAVFVQGGRLLLVGVQTGTPLQPDTLNTEGFCHRPAWGDWGLSHIAYLQGITEEAPAEVRIQAPFSNRAVTVLTGLADARALAWSPTQKVLALSQNTGAGGEIVLIFDLPIP